LFHHHPIKQTGNKAKKQVIREIGVKLLQTFYGADHDLESLIRAHLFIISPNNSGSTFLKNVFATSKQTWNLEEEGQHTEGFAGQSTTGTGKHLIWAAKPEWIDMFCNESEDTWSQSRQAWYVHAFSQNPEANVFVTKSPPFLLNVAQLQQYFSNAKFIFMVRNPYAVVEGIYRRRSRQRPLPGVDMLDAAAAHVMTCFQYQRKNIEAYHEHSTFFTYETLCAEPERIRHAIQALVPELNDVRLDQKVPVKGIYDEMLRNMNEQQIARLSADDLKRVNQIFEPHQDLLDYFGYSLIK
jgi:hypothetical protein